MSFARETEGLARAQPFHANPKDLPCSSGGVLRITEYGTGIPQPRQFYEGLSLEQNLRVKRGVDVG